MSQAVTREKRTLTVGCRRELHRAWISEKLPSVRTPLTLYTLRVVRLTPYISGGARDAMYGHRVGANDDKVGTGLQQGGEHVDEIRIERRAHLQSSAGLISRPGARSRSY